MAGCETKPYASAPEPALVESIQLEVKEFQGRPDVTALIRGRLSSNAAQLVDSRQYRRGNLLHIEVLEQTPRATLPTNRMPHPPFQTRIPLEVLGLLPGERYVVDANGIRTEFRMPGGTDPLAGRD